MKKIVLVFCFAYGILLHAEGSRDICRKAIKSNPVDISLVQSSCLKAIEEDKDMPALDMSWLYLLGGDFDKSIFYASKAIDDEKIYIAFMNKAQSYLLKRDIKSATKNYKLYLSHGNSDDESVQYFFDLLFKIYPDKRKDIQLGLDKWNEMYLRMSKLLESSRIADEFAAAGDFKKSIEIHKLNEYETLKYLGESSLALSNYRKYISSIYYMSLNVFLDSSSNLMWQDDERAKSIRKTWLTNSNWDSKNYFNTKGDTAATYCSNLSHAGYIDWRLPTINELSDLYWKKRLLKNNSSSAYLSTTTPKGAEHFAMYFDFSSGRDYFDYKNRYINVRCVREIFTRDSN